ncbi:hypothetical protein WG947_14060 [Pontibacter sp. H259]|uniref:hypothetical protein n=1 Tax=Pontibacter sp. H259 TaxID=3133421 RepID=UPI0030BFAEE3
MNLIYAILAGLAGTAAMTAVLYLLSFTNRALRVPQVLGTMLLGKTHPDGGLSGTPSTHIIGTAAHFLVGILYAIGYLSLWESGVGSLTFSWSLLMGFANGIFAMIVWYFFFLIHPKPPIIKLERYLVTLIFAHVIFGFIVTYVYYQLTINEHPFWQ